MGKDSQPRQCRRARAADVTPHPRPGVSTTFPPFRNGGGTGAFRAGNCEGDVMRRAKRDRENGRDDPYGGRRGDALPSPDAAAMGEWAH